ncbi:hypothetical protein MAR_002124 [Mya arenaria]|uniref:G-protein coupled receptors family 1 profile domain-containing protein n=1 Tax=Mya arenaria TaxID=6604 RepID=A0ABY7FHQ0_MYAAR|nr:hypothetical protein MAR_002124 [Mya arenaria]
MRYSVKLDRPCLCKISRFSTYTMSSSSAAILVAIAVDRYRRICRPHGPQFSAKASKYISICCIALALYEMCLRDSLTKSNGSQCIHLRVRIGRSTLMVYLITLAYIVSFLPFYVIAIIRQTDSTFVSRMDGAGYMVYHVCLWSYLLSSAINPIIYSFCNSQYRIFCFNMKKKRLRSRRSLL